MHVLLPIAQKVKNIIDFSIWYCITQRQKDLIKTFGIDV